MTLSADDPGLFLFLFSEEVTRKIFSAEQTVQRMVEVEAALARAEGQLHVIPSAAADRITAAAADFAVDFDQLQVGIDKAGVPVSELVRQLRSHVGPDAADFVHWGATTQDIFDTARILQIRAAADRLEAILHELLANLAQLADRHRSTLMAARTHSQQALPTTFGLKVAGWLSPLVRHHTRLAELRPRLLVIQFGGAAGTLAALGEKGPAVQRKLAANLGLGVPLGVWHTQRDTLVEFAGWLALVTGSLGKMAQDIILMAQSEVGELRETADPSRGGSSTMPQKSNPMVSEAILAIHRTNAGHLSALVNALIQEHERATHGWQVEWLNLPPMVIMTAAALEKANWLAQNLVVDAGQMRANVAASNGLMLAEPATFALTQHMPHAAAKQLVSDAVKVALSGGRHLLDVLREQVDFDIDWDALGDEGDYLGAVEDFIDQIIAAAAAV